MTLLITLSIIVFLMTIIEIKLHIHMKLCKIIFPVCYGIIIGISQVHTKLMFVKPNIYIIISSILIGYLCYIVSLVIVGTKFNIPNLLFNTLREFKGRMKKEYRRETIRNLYSSSVEELLYRGIFQVTIYEITHNFIITIILGSLLFSVTHYFKKSYLVQKIDIAVFSIIITICFHITHDIWFCILLHIFRNYYIINQKYVYLFQKQTRMMNLAKNFAAQKQIKERGTTFNE